MKFLTKLTITWVNDLRSVIILILAAFWPNETGAGLEEEATKPESFQEEEEMLQQTEEVAVELPEKYIDILADIVGCTKYKSSMAEFWFLDTLANLLRRAQTDLLFSTDYQYNLVRSIFTFSPEYVLIDAPYMIQQPRRLYAPLKPLKKEKSTGKSKAPAAKGKKKDAWHRRRQILPLAFAADDSLLDKYWPQPPEPEPVPEVLPKSKPKGKGKN
ncbi:Uncharacterized protein OBRU01_06415 [Operophtera brumata]|uniref:Uncharacterized protein n=1 Tax=Operophtera brumata TaxID=104452 RepID=A0A0L7LIC8_OPEBR|nr:Uncharacterized protein OBRU01_06415 [Operophtera brumata]